MSLFTEALVNDYRNDPQIRGALNGVKLLTYDEFYEWYSPEETRRSPRIEENRETQVGKPQLRLERKQSFEKRVRTIQIEVVQQLADQVCQGNIDEQYGINTVKKVLDKSNFDILIAVEPNYNVTSLPLTHTKNVVKNKLSRVLGFIIAELGECKDKPDVYSVNLICTRKVGNASIKSILLLGAFLYCIKNSISTINNEEGILELADGYVNMPGFISYTKMGFRKDLTLSGQNCFKDYTNLPMKVDISALSNEEIINRASGTIRPTITAQQDDSGLYNASPDIAEDKKAQVIALNNIAYKLAIDPEILLYPTRLGNIEEHVAILPYLSYYKARIQRGELNSAKNSILRDIKREINQLLYGKGCFGKFCEFIGLGGKYTKSKKIKKSKSKKYKKTYKK
jgi:hypothetical protein